MSEARIRLAEARDLPAVLRLWTELSASEQALGVPIRADDEAQRAWMASFERHLGRFSFLWVAESRGHVAAFLLARLKPKPLYLGGELVGELCSIFVAAELRSTGTGATMVQEAVRWLAAAGAQAIEVEAHAANAGARAFWERLGFRIGFHTFRRTDLPPRET